MSALFEVAGIAGAIVVVWFALVGWKLLPSGHTHRS